MTYGRMTHGNILIKDNYFAENGSQGVFVENSSQGIFVGDPNRRYVPHCDHGNYARGLAEVYQTGSWANGYPIRPKGVTA